MYDYYNSAGYEMIDTGNDQWIFDIKGVQKYHGSFKEVVLFANKKCLISIAEIEFGASLMTQLEHNGLHFGSQGNFIFSFYREIDFSKAS